jgi:hypothetical protein
MIGARKIQYAYHTSDTKVGFILGTPETDPEGSLQIK